MEVGPTIRRRRLGADLRSLREAASLKLEEVAGHLGVAPSTLSRIETGKAPTRTSYLAVMLDLYGVDDVGRRRQLMDLAREGQRRGWWAEAEDLLPAGSGRYLGLEAEAAQVLAFEAQLVHGLARTPGYARAVIRAGRFGLTEAQVGRLVSVQSRRQEAMRARGGRLHLIVDESVLYRTLGAPGVLAEQLAWLAASAADSWLTFQVLPLAGGSPAALSESFAILRFTEPGDPDVACARSLRGQMVLDQRRSEVAALRERFGALSRAAFEPERSATMIAGLARHHGGDA